jgi:hypothetical protein
MEAYSEISIDLSFDGLPGGGIGVRGCEERHPGGLSSARRILPRFIPERRQTPSSSEPEPKASR